ncbi:unnamed protein product [Linum tenue]|uniref:Pectinesterase catalytic domain-containing protein n=2 Tax=Linum tenue TaxID=586396 RepID=A0AAV0HJJ5_9ROSI|nr:unnamed protein product [Linum tenue]
MSRLSAVVAYQSTCRDALRMCGGTRKVRTRLGKPIKMTSNALAIINSAFNRSSQPPQIPDDGNLASGANSLPRPDAVVAGDGSGRFRTITEALSAYKLNELGRYVIYVKAGEYNESVTIAKDRVNVYMYGDGPDRTVVFGSRSQESGLLTYETATVAVLGDGFVCRSMAIQNRGKSGGATVAVRVQADRSIFYNVTIEGNQAPLYALAHRQFYRECKISGSTDLILGDAAAVIQDSEILVSPDSGVPAYGFAAVTVQGRAERFETTGFVLQNCTIKEIGGARVEIVLGKQWRKGSRVVVMESYLGEGIAAEGWKVRVSSAGGGDFAVPEKSLYAEFENYGPGANTSKRVRSSTVIKERSKAVQYAPNLFIQGYSWIPQAGVPYQGGL